MAETEKSSSLKDLSARLRKARASADVAAGRAAPSGRSRSGLGFALRLGVELVSALAIGVGIGLLLDYWLGTKPWLMLLFFIFGSVAGFMNVYRAATGIGQGVGYRPARKGADDEAEATGQKKE